MLALDPEDVMSAIVFTGDGGDAVGKWCCCEQVLSEDSSLVVKGGSRCRQRAYSLMMKVWQVLFGNNNLVVAPMADEMSRMRLSIGGRRGARRRRAQQRIL